MSSTEETPAQQAARLRRERREAKIRAGGSARLEKITSLSGRTLASAHESPSPSPQPTAAPAIAASEPHVHGPPRSKTPIPPAPAPAPRVEDQSLESIQAQQEYLRALLRAHPPNQQQTQETAEDPTVKLLNAMLGDLAGGDTAAAPGAGGAGGAAPGGLSPADLTSALGLPPFLSNMLLGGMAAQQPLTPEEKRRDWIWKLLHVFFSFAIGVYLLVLIGSSVAMYGSPPPPPATAQNPFVVFMTGELLLSGTRMLAKGREGKLATPGTWVQLLKDVVRDGSIVVFVFGMGSWWREGWQAYLPA
ncbi:hypothetical protein VTN00DRAFT_10244 [Thermoascus crustaceus]|uniref:uncharacterized protein n=1 Tax=Thermoascus crustaceus TaxID=5088 RepID=UPI003743428D